MKVNSMLLGQLKLVELNILKKFVAICDSLNLKYFLMDGTMLGAIRHHGFIPWDDDIDVGMFRADYEFFLSKAQELLPSYYFLQTFMTEPNVLNTFAKIRDSRTTFIETSHKLQKINHGIYIDIFPLDYFPESEELQKHIQTKRKFLNLRIRKEFTLPKEYKGSWCRELAKSIVGTVMQIKYPSVQDALLEQNKLYRSCKTSNQIINYCGAYGRKSIVPVEWYGNGKKAVFEDITVTVPQKAELYLKQVYGDFMKYPPENQRKPHHYAEIIDTEKSYLEYICF